jgi:hypothetical protein
VRVNNSPSHQRRDVRVGEAFTKDRKSSAAARDGLVVMARDARDSLVVDGMQAARYAVGRCSSVVSNGVSRGMG